MGGKLFNFVYETMRKRANDPTNTTLWLPKVLGSMEKPGGGGKVLPIQGTDWSMGELTGETGTTFQRGVATQWWQFKYYTMGKPPAMAAHQPIACPTNPWPVLTMPKVTALGLDNLFVLPNPVTVPTDTGYVSVVTLQLGYYPQLTPVQLVGEYAIDQCVCSAAATKSGDPPPTACDNWIPTENVHGTGTFQMTMTDSFVDATLAIRVGGAGSGRTLTGVVTAVVLRGPSVGAMPTLKLNSVTSDSELSVKGLWTSAAKNALESPSGVKSLIQNLNGELNKASNLQRLTDMLSKHLVELLDQNLGAVPAGQLPAGGQPGLNAADQYLFDRTRFALNDPTGSYYVPKLVLSNASPGLEPYMVGTIPVPDQSAPPFSITQIAFTEAKITGLSNLVAPVATLVMTEGGIDATLLPSTLNPPPQVTVGGKGVPGGPLTLNGNFSFLFSDVPGHGTFTTQISSSSITASVLLGGEDADSLTVTFTKLNLQAAYGGNISTQLRLADSSFGDLVQGGINTDSVRQAAVNKINESVIGKLGEIGAATTDGVRKLIKSKLGS